MYSNEDITALAKLMEGQLSPWYADPVIIVTIWVVVSIICAMITTLIAHENERSKPLAFLTGLFLNIYGIIIYAIIGESIALRVALERQATRDEIERERQIKSK